MPRLPPQTYQNGAERGRQRGADKARSGRPADHVNTEQRKGRAAACRASVAERRPGLRRVHLLRHDAGERPTCHASQLLPSTPPSSPSPHPYPHHSPSPLTLALTLTLTLTLLRHEADHRRRGLGRRPLAASLYATRSSNPGLTGRANRPIRQQGRDRTGQGFVSLLLTRVGLALDRP